MEFGQSISVVSNANAWETSKATELSWTEGDVWQGELEVPDDVGNLEFKLVKMANGVVVEWEEGDNKSCTVSKGSKTLDCSWGTNELTEKKATRKRSSSPTKKKKEEAIAAVVPGVAQNAVPVEETVSVEDQTVVEETPEALPTDPEAFDHITASVSGDEIMYTFDEDDHGESAADIARRIYGS